MPKNQRKNRWSADVTAHSDALDLEPKVFEKETAGEIAAVAQALGRVERSAENERLPVSDVDVDLLHQSRGAKPAYRTEADPRSGERKIAQAIWTQSLNVVQARRVRPGLERAPGADRWRKEHHDAQADSPTTLASAEPAARPRSRRPTAIRNGEVEDYQHGVATPPGEQGGRETNPRTTRARGRRNNAQRSIPLQEASAPFERLRRFLAEARVSSGVGKRLDRLVARMRCRDAKTKG